MEGRHVPLAIDLKEFRKGSTILPSECAYKLFAGHVLNL